MANIVKKLKDAVLGAPSLLELKTEEASLLAELSANEAVAEDEDSTVDQIQAALTRSQALRMRLETVRRRIQEAHQRTVEAERQSHVSEGERLAGLASEKDAEIKQAIAALQALIKEHGTLVEQARAHFAKGGARTRLYDWGTLYDILKRHNPKEAAVAAQLRARMEL